MTTDTNTETEHDTPKGPEVFRNTPVPLPESDSSKPDEESENPGGVSLYRLLGWGTVVGAPIGFAWLWTISPWLALGGLMGLLVLLFLVWRWRRRGGRRRALRLSWSRTTHQRGGSGRSLGRMGGVGGGGSVGRRLGAGFRGGGGQLFPRGAGSSAGMRSGGSGGGRFGGLGRGLGARHRSGGTGAGGGGFGSRVGGSGRNRPGTESPGRLGRGRGLGGSLSRSRPGSGPGSGGPRPAGRVAGGGGSRRGLGRFLGGMGHRSGGTGTGAGAGGGRSRGSVGKTGSGGLSRGSTTGRGLFHGLGRAFRGGSGSGRFGGASPLGGSGRGWSPGRGGPLGRFRGGGNGSPRGFAHRMSRALRNPLTGSFWQGTNPGARFLTRAGLRRGWVPHHTPWSTTHQVRPRWGRAWRRVKKHARSVWRWVHHHRPRTRPWVDTDSPWRVDPNQVPTPVPPRSRRRWWRRVSRWWGRVVSRWSRRHHPPPATPWYATRVRPDRPQLGPSGHDPGQPRTPSPDDAVPVYHPVGVGDDNSLLFDPLPAIESRIPDEPSTERTTMSNPSAGVAQLIRGMTATAFNAPAPQRIVMYTQSAAHLRLLAGAKTDEASALRAQAAAHQGQEGTQELVGQWLRAAAQLEADAACMSGSAAGFDQASSVLAAQTGGAAA
jgi:hypothetical protein